jgi:hypothetical protein
MLKIRPDQLEAFRPAAEESFVVRLVEHLRVEQADVLVKLPDGEVAVAQLPDELLREMVVNGLARGERYGLSLEYTLAAFVLVMFAMAPNFDEHPLIRLVLVDESVPPDSRLDELVTRTTEQNWEAVRENYSPAAWNLKPGAKV